MIPEEEKTTNQVSALRENETTENDSDDAISGEGRSYSPRQNQKIKLVKLIEILRTESDKEHPLTTSQLVSKLVSQGISSERRTLAKDIAFLNEYGYEIESVYVSRERGYYTKGRELQPAEVKILIDAVHAATFIPEEKSEELIHSLAAMAGTYRSVALEGRAVCYNTRKHTNQEVYRNVEELQKAIHGRLKASFYYFDRNEHGEIVYRKDKALYVVEPMALVYNNDNYYLMCHEEERGTVNYRVDRMTNVSVVYEAVSEKAIVQRDSIKEYQETVFKMYGGPSVKAVLQFENKLIGAIQDKFGEDTPMLRIDDGHCVASVTVQVSPTFWGWLFQFAGRMQLISPTELVDEYKKRAQLIVDGK